MNWPLFLLSVPTALVGILLYAKFSSNIEMTASAPGFWTWSDGEVHEARILTASNQRRITLPNVTRAVLQLNAQTNLIGTDDGFHVLSCDPFNTTSYTAALNEYGLICWYDVNAVVSNRTQVQVRSLVKISPDYFALGGLMESLSNYGVFGVLSTKSPYETSFLQKMSAIHGVRHMIYFTTLGFLVVARGRYPQEKMDWVDRIDRHTDVISVYNLTKIMQDVAREGRPSLRIGQGEKLSEKMQASLTAMVAIEPNGLALADGWGWRIFKVEENGHLKLQTKGVLPRVNQNRRIVSMAAVDNWLVIGTNDGTSLILNSCDGSQLKEIRHDCRPTTRKCEIINVQVGSDGHQSFSLGARDGSLSFWKQQNGQFKLMRTGFVEGE